jgi:Ni,Fe-hydrogenase III small subunit/formate hydrogenlyase subunit 6/NADH:ubiquinone oxidoreductase subunit I
MFEIIKSRILQKHRTITFPKESVTMPDRFRGLPIIEPVACESDCAACMQICPTEAIGSAKDGELKIDMGKCVFCGKCSAACPSSTVRFSTDHRLSANSRSGLTVSVVDKMPHVKPLAPDKLSMFKRSFNIRVVSAGGCNACEADVNVLSTIVFDLSRFGIHYVAAPRHADAVLVTGPVPRNMHAALKKTYDAVPDPKVVIAVGACAISGGLFLHNSQESVGADSLLPVDLYIPGCPPHPMTILDGLLRFLDRIK